MKKLLTILLCLILSCQSFVITAYAKPDWPSDTGIEAEGGIVVDADSGAMLFGQSIHVPYAPASITKLLTALVVLEHADLDDMVTFSDDAVNNVEEGSGNSINIAVGDQLSVEDCLYALLFVSSNQAANALAEHVAGDREEFVRMMNDRIAQIGCTESNFANPSGLNDENQYVTPYDMALIARTAFQNEKLLEIEAEESRKLGPTINSPGGRTVTQEHRLLITTDASSPFYCPEAVAGKTGYTSIARNTLVTLAKKDGRQVISVILRGSKPQYFVDGKTLIDFGFNRFQNLVIADNETSYTTGEEPVTVGEESFAPSDLTVEPSSVITLPKDAVFTDAEKSLITELPKGHPEAAVALIQYTYNDRKIGQAYLLRKDAPVSSDGIQKEENATGEAAASSLGEQEGTDAGQEKPTGTATGTGIKLPHLSIKFSPALLIGLVFLALGAAGASYVVYARRREAREMEQRRQRRRQRLMEEGCTEEFDRLWRQRMEQGSSGKRGRPQKDRKPGGEDR